MQRFMVWKKLHVYVKKQIGNDCNNYKLILEGIQKLQSLRLLDVHV